MQKTPQKVRRLSSNSDQSLGGSNVGEISLGAESSRCRPIISTSRTARDVLMAARVNIMFLASYTAMQTQAWAWATVRKCSPEPYGSGNQHNKKRVKKGVGQNQTPGGFTFISSASAYCRARW